MADKIGPKQIVQLFTTQVDDRKEARAKRRMAGASTLGGKAKSTAAAVGAIFVAGAAGALSFLGYKGAKKGAETAARGFEASSNTAEYKEVLSEMKAALEGEAKADGTLSKESKESAKELVAQISSDRKDQHRTQVAFSKATGGRMGYTDNPKYVQEFKESMEALGVDF